VAAAQHYSDLIVWKLADEIRVEVFKLTKRAPFSRDYKLKSQTDDAMDSVCRNIAEGFGCRSHVEFARFLEFSRRSLNEVFDCLRSAELKDYLTPAEVAPIRQLAARLYPALSSFMAYLTRTANRTDDREKRSHRRP
jgi:four helix bundle protein